VSNVDPAANEIPHEPDEVDVERGSADGSAKANAPLEESLADAGDVRGVETHHEVEQPVRGDEDEPAVS
jgi:hypothetical protein